MKWYHIYSCCADGVTTLVKTPSHYHTIMKNDSYVICANTSAHQLQIDEHKFCSSGSWKSVELAKDRCEIRNVNGHADIKYWGNNPNHRADLRCVSANRHQFPLESGLYCVSKNLFETT